MTFLSIHPIKTTCAVIAGAVGSWTLGGILSTITSLVAIVVGALQIYDWVQRKRNKKG